MQQLGSAAHPDKLLMRTCKQEAALWKKELMASPPKSTESHLPSRHCMRAANSISTFCPLQWSKHSSIAIFPYFPHMLQSSFVFPTARWTHLNREAKFHHHSVLIAPLALGRNVYLLHKQAETAFNLVTVGLFSILWQSQITPHHHQSRWITTQTSIKVPTWGKTCITMQSLQENPKADIPWVPWKALLLLLPFSWISLLTCSISLHADWNLGTKISRS